MDSVSKMRQNPINGIQLKEHPIIFRDRCNILRQNPMDPVSPVPWRRKNRNGAPRSSSINKPQCPFRGVHEAAPADKTGYGEHRTSKIPQPPQRLDCSLPIQLQPRTDILQKSISRIWGSGPGLGWAILQLS